MADSPWTWRYAETFPFLERVEAGMPPAIISLTANGALRGPESSRHIPESLDDTADSVFEAYEAGASLVHLHARDPHVPWKGATDPEDWYRLHRAIRERCPDIVIMDSTEGDPGMTFEERTACLAAAPEVASFTLAPEMRRFSIPPREGPNGHAGIHVDGGASVSYDDVGRLAAMLKEAGIKPELELKSTGGVQVVHHLVRAALIDPPYMVQTVMGYQTGNYATVQTVLDFLRDLPDDTLWLCMAKGAVQLHMTSLALLMGGHVRVGMEDNVYLRPGVQGSNADFVARVGRIAGELERPIATPAQARAMLGLNPEPSAYS